VLACEDTFQADVRMWGGELGDWFWTNLIPSPREIERKTITGSYKCGFFFLPGWESPVDIIWKDAKIGRMLLEIAHPFTQALFYLWAAETALDALSRWQSVMYRIARCDADRNECLIGNGHSILSYGHNWGGAALGEIIYDPNHWGIEMDTSVSVPFATTVGASAYGHIIANAGIIDNCEIQMCNGNDVLASVGIGHMDPGQETAFSIGWGGSAVVGAIQPRILADVSGSPINRPVYLVSRLTVSEGPKAKRPPPNDPLDFRCRFDDGIPLPMPYV